MPAGLYTAADVPVLAVYCTAWSLYRDALATIKREGMMITGPQGQDVAHPAVAMAAKQAEIILRASDRLGMSPSARTRLQVPEAAAGRFGGLMGGVP
jgi:P27 family predicted phage terminase small subunit